MSVRDDLRLVGFAVRTIVALYGLKQALLEEVILLR